MFGKRMKALSRVLFLAVFMTLGVCLLFTGCSTAQKQLDPSVTAPQVIVNPDSIRLGVAKVTGTDIVFEGSGFEAGDAVFIALVGPEDTEVAIADGRVGEDGTFKAPVGPLGKVTGILRATVSGNYKEDGSYNQYVVLTQDPIPTGTYTVVATGMLSDQTAKTQMEIKRPGIGDRFKDFLGKKMGKIQDKR